VMGLDLFQNRIELGNGFVDFPLHPIDSSVLGGEASIQSLVLGGEAGTSLLQSGTTWRMKSEIC
jgi:hypothetical protein